MFDNVGLFIKLFCKKSTLGNAFIINVVICRTNRSDDILKKYIPVYLFIDGNMYYVRCDDCYENSEMKGKSFHAQKIDSSAEQNG